jgi:hypothetical protein
MVLNGMTEMVFVELPIFTRHAAALFADDELRETQNRLLENPLLGDLIPGGRGLRKLRVPLEGRGKRGGARVIYYLWAREDRCYLVFAYAKNEVADLTQEQLRRLAAVMREEVSDE